MTLSEFIKRLKSTPAEISFQNTMDIIDAHYIFEPVSFTNGEVINEAGQNSGSCKLFSFAKLQNLTEEETLYCFGEHYQKVIEDPEGNSHQNIRNFMKYSWEGISFNTLPLIKK